VRVSVAILAQGTDYLLFFDGIVVLLPISLSVITVGNLTLHLHSRYLRKSSRPSVIHTAGLLLLTSGSAVFAPPPFVNH
jgi:hypothetical protein